MNKTHLSTIMRLLSSLAGELNRAIVYCRGEACLIYPKNRVQRHRKATVLSSAHRLQLALTNSGVTLRGRELDQSLELVPPSAEILQIAYDVHELINMLRVPRPSTECQNTPRLKDFVETFQLSLSAIASPSSSRSTQLNRSRRKNRRQHQGLKLSSLELAVYHAHHVQGLTVKEIAQMRGCSTNNVYRALHSAKEKVKAMQSSSRSVRAEFSLDENRDSPLSD